MTSQTSKKSTNPNCARVGCLTSPCEHERPPKKADTFCVDFDDGIVRSGIPQLEKKQVYVCGKCLQKGDVVVSYAVVSRGACERCGKTRSCYAVK